MWSEWFIGTNEIMAILIIINLTIFGGGRINFFFFLAWLGTCVWYTSAVLFKVAVVVVVVVVDVMVLWCVWVILLGDIFCCCCWLYIWLGKRWNANIPWRRVNLQFTKKEKRSYFGSWYGYCCSIFAVSSQVESYRYSLDEVFFYLMHNLYKMEEALACLKWQWLLVDSHFYKNRFPNPFSLIVLLAPFRNVCKKE